MKVSFNCLKQFVDLNNISAFEVADKLTFAGVEVETVEPIASGTNLIIGKIIDCKDHPDSDHLHILQVDIGPKYGIKQIVCGAPNARKNLKVIVAMVGAKLPEVTIKKGVIRGVESDGMCCSLLELGVDKKYLKDEQMSGIEELNDDAPIGLEDVLTYLGLDDVVLDLKVLANRPDLLSVINIAREVGALLNRPTHLPKSSEIGVDKFDFKVGSNTNKCVQFSAKVIQGIKNVESPHWMKSYLMAMGIRSIDALVDIGNYVMLVSGQPLHMYDLDKLSSNELIARDDFESPFVALDDKEYQLQKGDIVISCHNQAMCLGGVMGSKQCAIDKNTINLVIEAASFDATTIRHTSARLGLSSESSMRFVKGTNHFQAEFVLNYAASLIKEICGGNCFYKNIHYQCEQYQDKFIKTTLAKINGRLGSNFDLKTVVDTLHKLGFDIEADGDNLKIKIPNYRLDITCDADISEEIIRYLGFEYIKSDLPSLHQSVGSLNQHLAKTRYIEEYLTKCGLDQCLTYTLVSKTKLDEFNYLFKGEPYHIINPISEDHEYVRLSILPSLIESAIYNLKRQNKNLSLFETSDVMSKQERGICLAVVLTGQDLQQGYLKCKPIDFYDVKGIVEGIMNEFQISPTRYSIEQNNLVEELHPGRSALIKIGKQVIGYCGMLHPTYMQNKDIDKTPIAVLELRLDYIYDMKIGTVKMCEISKFPSVERDLAFVVARQVEVKDLIKEAKMAGKGIVSNVDVFDIYEGENVTNDCKSVALKIIYNAKDHTLKDQEVIEAETKIKESLQKKFHALLRG